MMEPTTLNTELVREGRQVTLTLRGAIRAKTVPELARIVDNIGAETVDRITMDLGGVQWIDSRGLGALVGWHRHFTTRDVHFNLRGLPERIMEIFAVCNLNNLFNIDGEPTPAPKQLIRSKDEALWNSHRYAEQVVAALGEGVIALDRAGEIVLVNQAAADLLEAPEHALHGKRLMSALRERLAGDTGAAEEVLASLDRVIHGEEPRWRGEIALQGVEGGPPRRVVVIATSLHGEERMLGCVIGLSDQTALRTTERLAQILSHAVESISESVLISELDDTIIYANRAFEEHFGFSREEIRGKKPSVIRSDTNPPGLEEEILRTTLERGGFRGEVINRDRQGNEFPIALATSVVRDQRGEPIALIGIASDVSERRRAEESLRHSERLVSEAFEQCNAVVYHRDFLTETYTFMGNAIERLTGFTAEEFNTDLWKTRVRKVELHGEHRGIDPAELNRRFRRGEVNRWMGDTQILHRDGSLRWLRDTSAAITDASGNVVESIGILMDIDEIKRSEEAVRTASRLEATATLAGGIAHDFNNLMVGVLGSASMLREELDAGHPHLWFIDQIEGAAEKAGQLAQQMLAYARGGKYQPQAVALNEIIQETLRIQRHSFSNRIRITLDLAADLRPIQADPTQMTQVVMNLCLNAAEAIEGDGTVTIRTANTERDGRPAVQLVVEDTGAGMTAEVRERIFEPFFTTKFQGRGLGMAAVYGIVKNHEGLVEIESAPGKGSAVIVTLPAAQSPAPVAPAATAEAPSAASETVLLIDDEPIVIEVGATMLRRLGYHPIVADGGEEGIALAEEHASQIDLVVLDMWMPGKGGMQVFPILQQILPGKPILICSGFELDEAAQSLLDLGAVGFLRKPFRLSELAPVLRRALGHRRGSDPKG